MEFAEAWQLGQELNKAFAADKRAADKMAERPLIIERRVQTRAQIESDRLRSQSIGEMFCEMGCENWKSDPKMRKLAEFLRKERLSELV